MRVRDLLHGQRFGRLLVIERAPIHGGVWWRCQCECGTERVVRSLDLFSGNTRSCGCLRRENSRRLCQQLGPDNVTHGDARKGHITPEFTCWATAQDRCYNPNNPRFQHYGGRGIGMCDEWRASYAAFLAYVGRRPSPKHSIDRINNDGNYEPGNVRWATYKEQAHNQRHPRRRITEASAPLA